MTDNLLNITYWGEPDWHFIIDLDGYEVVYIRRNDHSLEEQSTQIITNIKKHIDLDKDQKIIRVTTTNTDCCYWFPHRNRINIHLDDKKYMSCSDFPGCRFYEMTEKNKKKLKAIVKLNKIIHS